MEARKVLLLFSLILKKVLTFNLALSPLYERQLFTSTFQDERLLSFIIAMFSFPRQRQRVQRLSPFYYLQFIQSLSARNWKNIPTQKWLHCFYVSLMLFLSLSFLIDMTGPCKLISTGGMECPYVRTFVSKEPAEFCIFATHFPHFIWWNICNRYRSVKRIKVLPWNIIQVEGLSAVHCDHIDIDERCWHLKTLRCFHRLHNRYLPDAYSAAE